MDNLIILQYTVICTGLQPISLRMLISTFNVVDILGPSYLKAHFLPNVLNQSLILFLETSYVMLIADQSLCSLICQSFCIILSYVQFIEWITATFPVHSPLFPSQWNTPDSALMLDYGHSLTGWHYNFYLKFWHFQIGYLMEGGEMERSAMDCSFIHQLSPRKMFIL